MNTVAAPQTTVENKSTQQAPPRLDATPAKPLHEVVEEIRQDCRVAADQYTDEVVAQGGGE